MPSLTRDKLLLPPLNIIECPDGSGSGNTGDGNTGDNTVQFSPPTFLVGTVISHMASADYVPEGCVRADGSEYTESEFKSMYNDFLMTGKLVTCTYSEYTAQLLISGNCGKFALDTVNKKFRVPLYKDGDSITQANNASELGKSYKAGLPNITGEILKDSGDYSGLMYMNTANPGTQTGALKASNKNGQHTNLSGGSGDGSAFFDSLEFDASLSNSIYGNSDTVTDEQVRLRHFIIMSVGTNDNTSPGTSPGTGSFDPYEIGEWYYFRHPTVKPGFAIADGRLLSGEYQGKDITEYPIWEYLQTPEGQLLCITETEWQAMNHAVWHTNADGTTVGWDGVGGAPYYVQDLDAGTLRMPDVRGMYPEAAGFDSLDVGDVHGDGIREIAGGDIVTTVGSTFYTPRGTGALAVGTNSTNAWGSENSTRQFPQNVLTFNASRTVPVANKNQPRAWGALVCSYLGGYSKTGTNGSSDPVPSFLIGSIIPFYTTDSYIPDGCVPPDGAEYTEAMFPTFYNDYLVVGKVVTCTYAEFATQVGLTGNCGKFALDTVNKKFRVPLYKDGDSITQAASASEIGKSYEAGLPNITGTFEPWSMSSTPAAAATGAFKTDGYGRNNSRTTGSPGTESDIFTFDSSRVNTIYGNSDTVTDEQIRLRHFVVLASAQNNSSMFDWSAYMAGLAGKLNTELDNVSIAGQSKIASVALTIGSALSVMSNAGTWTIAGCRIGVPLYIHLQGSTARNDVGGAQIREVSGVKDGDLNGMVLGLVGGTTRPNFHWLIPSSETVVLSVYNMTTSPTCYLRAYQQGV